MEYDLKLILLKIANGIGNTGSTLSIIDFAKIGGCDEEEIKLINTAISEISCAESSTENQLTY